MAGIGDRLRPARTSRGSAGGGRKNAEAISQCHATAIDAGALPSGHRPDSGSVTALAIDTGVFAITGGTCGATPITLAAGANCTLTMTFSPAATGPAAGTLSFTASAGAGIGPNATVALSGTGMAPPPAPITTVPVNSPWALAALLAMFGLLAGVTLRRR